VNIKQTKDLNQVYFYIKKVDQQLAYRRLPTYLPRVEEKQPFSPLMGFMSLLGFKAQPFISVVEIKWEHLSYLEAKALLSKEAFQLMKHCVSQLGFEQVDLQRLLDAVKSLP